MQNVFEWINLYIAVPLAIAGFWFTIRQALLAKKAAESAKTAAEGIKETVNSTLTTALVHKLDGLEADLESSVHDGNRRLASYQLLLWRRGAGEFRALLDESPEDSKLKRSIQASIKASADAKEAIMDPASDLKLVTVAALKAIAVVTGQIGTKSVNVLNKGIDR